MWPFWFSDKPVKRFRVLYDHPGPGRLRRRQLSRLVSREEAYRLYEIFDDAVAVLEVVKERNGPSERRRVRLNDSKHPQEGGDFVG